MSHIDIYHSINKARNDVSMMEAHERWCKEQNHGHDFGFSKKCSCGLTYSEYLNYPDEREVCVKARTKTQRVLCRVVEVSTDGVIVDIVCIKDNHLIKLREAIESGLILYAEKDYRFHAEIEKIDNQFTKILKYELDNRLFLKQYFDVEDYLAYKNQIKIL